MVLSGSRAKPSQKEVTFSVTFSASLSLFLHHHCSVTVYSCLIAWMLRSHSYTNAGTTSQCRWQEPAAADVLQDRGERETCIKTPALQVTAQPEMQSWQGDLWSSENRKCNWFFSLRSMTGVTFPELDKGGPDVRDRFLHKHFIFLFF